MSEVKVNKISPRSGTTVTLGDSGDTFTLASGVSLTGVNATFSGDLTVDTDTLYVDSTNNRVGIGTSSPTTKLSVVSSTNAGISVNDGTVNTILYNTNSSNGSIGTTTNHPMAFYTNNLERMRIDTSGNLDMTIGNSGNIKLASGAGIDFSATAGTGTSELLDDYEEGTWTPTYEPVSGAFTSITYDTQNGKYVKIGKLVYVTGRVITDAITVGTASGTVRVSGLPFTTDSASFRGVTTIFGSDWGTDRPTFALGVASTTDFALYRHNEPNNPEVITVADMSTSANNNNIYFNLVYRIAG